MTSAATAPLEIGQTDLDRLGEALAALALAWRRSHPEDSDATVDQTVAREAEGGSRGGGRQPST